LSNAYFGNTVFGAAAAKDVSTALLLSLRHVAGCACLHAQTGLHLISIRCSVTFGTGVGFGGIAADALILRQSPRSKTVLLGGSTSGSFAMDGGKDGRADPADAKPG
jgi:hypothetical protein